MRGTILIVASLALLVFPSNAGAQDESAAKAHFEKGKALYNAGDWEGALGEFEASHAAMAVWTLRYYIGISLVELDRDVEAEAALKAYLEEGGAQVPAERRKEVEGLLAGIAAGLGSIDVAASVEGAQVYLDGKPAGATPLPAPLRAEAGEHTVAVKKEGYADREVKIVLSGGGVSAVSVTLEKVAPPAPPEKKVAPVPPPVVKEAKKKVSPMVPAGGALLALGLASLVAMAGTGGAALSLNGDLERSCAAAGGGYECAAGREGDMDRLDALVKSADALLALGLAAAAVGAPLLAVGLKKESKPAAPQVSASPAGLRLAWSW